MDENWIDLATWLQKELPSMEFTLNTATICTVWLTDDPRGEKNDRITKILELLGAYSCGPERSSESGEHRSHTSFGFYNQELIDYARRILPLPDGLQPGALFLVGPQPDQYIEKQLNRLYNKGVGDLPHQ